ncbi:MAG: FAD/FMN-containing dehydrogenase [Acidimicrobiales bacterium]|jgi:FAD/FMN-containing dehydrogenase
MVTRSLPVSNVAVIQKASTQKKATSVRVKKAPKKTTTKKITVKKVPLKTKKPTLKTKKTTPKKEAQENIPKKKLYKADLESNEVSEDVPETGNLRCEPLGHLLIEKLLREAGFAGGISTDKKYLDRYSTDESIFSIRPQIVIQPKNQQDVETAVKVLGKETGRFPSLSLTTRANGAGLSGGSLTDSIVVDVAAHLNKVTNIVTTKDITTVTCQPGALWSTVEKQLKKYHVYLPPVPVGQDTCTIGGCVANNTSGPDSLRFGSCADWVKSLEVTLHDGQTYTIAPLTYSQFKTLIKKDTAYARIAEYIFELISKNEKPIQNAKPKPKKNSAGYPLWDVLDTTVSSFKRGSGTFDLTRLISGSQGSIGIITSLTLNTAPIAKHTELVVVPIFDLLDTGKVITKALEFNPINIELFDDVTFDLALKTPQFFKNRLKTTKYYKVLLSMYTMYHVRYNKKTPALTLLITLDGETGKKRTAAGIAKTLRKNRGKRARAVTSEYEKEMLWQIQRASYDLSKIQDPSKRPAAFLEDMIVPPKNLSKFLIDIKKLLQKYNINATVHGHGGDGHLHFYPLLDFTNKTTPILIQKMSEEFFALAVKHDGNICGEHNDGIIRTPHLSKIFNKKIIELFKEVEHCFDPQDIFNPGKKVNPRFDITESLRKTN